MKKCPLCCSNHVESIGGDSGRDLSSEDFRITDSNYGKTGPLFKCLACDFRFVVFGEDVVQYYSQLEDEAYEEGREYRLAQQENLLKKLFTIAPGKGRLLDIGAGTGMLIQAAESMGVPATGVEPSRWASARANDLGYDVRCGVLPLSSLEDDLFDWVTCIDVIEHVHDPVALVSEAYKKLKPGGHFLVITPDVDSFLARMLKEKWWHYRMAHVGYFNMKNLESLLVEQGSEVVYRGRPGWFFKIAYLYDRLRHYIPILPQLKALTGISLINTLMNQTIPLNLGDSMMMIACKK